MNILCKKQQREFVPHTISELSESHPLDLSIFLKALSGSATSVGAVFSVLLEALWLSSLS